MPSELRVPDERTSLMGEVRDLIGLSPSARVELFCSIMAMVQVVWASLPPAERLRRLRIGEAIEPAPRPWWRGMRREAQP